MSKYRIGITEAGDAGIDLSWVHKISTVDGAVLITKNLTPEFCSEIKDRENIILHATITGYGGTLIEPNVPIWRDELDTLYNLVVSGFPSSRVVVRIDPIIPTREGLNLANQVFQASINTGFRRFRVSIVDMYRHARERFLSAGIKLPYDERFSPYGGQVCAVDSMLSTMKHYVTSVASNEISGFDPLRIEACAEPDLTEAIQCGCISDFDLKLLGLSPCFDSIGFQRRDCLCHSGKVELLNSKSQCPNGCLYCYWR